MLKHVYYQRHILIDSVNLAIPIDLKNPHKKKKKKKRKKKKRKDLKNMDNYVFIFCIQDQLNARVI